MKKLKMKNPINSSKVEYNEYDAYDNKSNESDDDKVIEEKFINVKEINIVGAQMHIIPLYEERDLMIENDIEIYIIDLGDFIS